MDSRIEVSSPFQTAEQQRIADLLGMYIFLASEIMLFGGLFVVTFVCRFLHRAEIVAASKQLHLWIGAANTAILLTSSLFIALSVQAGRAGRRRLTIACLCAAVCLGLGFLALKAVEYRLEYDEGILPGFGERLVFATPSQHLFMNIYMIATSLHALHLLIGIGLVTGVAGMIGRGRLALPKQVMTLETTGLYWHLVDVIWIFLYPALYLIR